MTYKIEPEHTRDWLTHAFEPSAGGHSRDETNPRDGRSSRVAEKRSRSCSDARLTSPHRKKRRDHLSLLTGQRRGSQ